MKLARKHLRASYAACALSLLLHQPIQAAAADPLDQPLAAQSATASADAALSQPDTNVTEGPLARWLALDTLSFSYRYRNMADTDGVHLFETGQERSLVKGRFKLDSEGKYSVNFRVSSGRVFNWAYGDNVGDGYQELLPATIAREPDPLTAKFYPAILADPTALNLIKPQNISRGWEMYTRELYLSATPIKQLTFEYGGLGFERGANTEITSYDEDGYLAGERLRLRDPQHVFFDQIAVTYGYVGDYGNPNFFTRGDRLGESNYHQFLLAKNVGHRLKASVDYTRQNGVDTMREAVFVRTPEIRLLDSARLELYQRTNSITLQQATFGTGAGSAFTGSKTFKKKFQLEGGYASIDPNYSVVAGHRFYLLAGFAFNADSFSLGNRLFTRATYTVNPYVTLFGFYTHQVMTPDFYAKNRQGMNFGMTIDFKNLLNDKLHLGIANSSRSN